MKVQQKDWQASEENLAAIKKCEQLSFALSVSFQKYDVKYSPKMLTLSHFWYGS